MKSVHIYIPKGASTFYANFRVKRNDPVRGVISSHINRSTGSADRRTAQSIANKMRQDALLGLFDVLPKLREDCPTVGKIIDLYLAKARIATARQVAHSFLTVVAEAEGIIDPADRDKARAVRLSSLTAKSMMSFRDRAAQGRTPRGINHMIRSARSIFSRQAMDYYIGLKLPDLSGWMQVAKLPEDKTHKYERIPDATLAAMDGSAPMMLRLARWHGWDTTMGQRWRNAWATYWLMRRAGLRNGEVEELRGEWFVELDGGTWLELITRPYWKPKGSQGRVPIARDLFDNLREVLGELRPGPDGHVLVGCQHARYRGAYIEVNTFIKRFIKGRRKLAYNLRKQYGSEMTRRYGIETASTLLRHSNIAVTWDHYTDDLKLSTVEAL